MSDDFFGIGWWNPKPGRQVVASGLTWERAPETTRLVGHRSGLATFVIFIGRPLWSRRLELVIGATVLVAWAKLAVVVPPRLAALVLMGVIAAGLRVDRVRGRVLRMLRHSELRRHWDWACRYGLVVSMNDRTPRPVSISDTPVGEVMRVQMPRSMSTPAAGGCHRGPGRGPGGAGGAGAAGSESGGSGHGVGHPS